jgi:hypothetical protein
MSFAASLNLPSSSPTDTAECGFETCLYPNVKTTIIMMELLLALYPIIEIAQSASITLTFQ